MTWRGARRTLFAAGVLTLASCVTLPNQLSRTESAVHLSEDEAALYREKLERREPTPPRSPPTDDGILTGVTFLYDPLTGARAVVDRDLRPLPDGRYEVVGPVPYVLEVRDGMMWVGLPIMGGRTFFFDAWGNVRLLDSTEVVRPWSATEELLRHGR